MTEPFPPAARGRAAAQRSETQRDVEAAWAARRELGPEYDEHIAAGLADRVEELVAYRTAELRHRREVPDAALEMARTSQRQGFVLGIISLGVGIPITAISATQVDPGLIGVAISWAGIVGVNMAHRLGSRRLGRRS